MGRSHRAVSPPTGINSTLSPIFLSGLICDQTILTAGQRSASDYPDTLRRIKYRDTETGRTFTFLTNNVSLPPLTIARLYKCRWQVELFFKWLKQHLRIKRFFGNTENAVKTQVWIAVSVSRPGRHDQEAPRHRRQSLHNPAGPERHSVRKNAAPSDAYRGRTHREKPPTA